MVFAIRTNFVGFTALGAELHDEVHHDSEDHQRGDDGEPEKKIIKLTFISRMFFNISPFKMVPREKMDSSR